MNILNCVLFFQKELSMSFVSFLVWHVLTRDRNVQYSTTVPLVSATMGFHKTFMDTTGRTMLTLNAINIVDDLRDRELVVTYDYPFMAGLRKPLVIFGGVLSLFIAAWAVGSLDVGIKGKITTSS